MAHETKQHVQQHDPTDLIQHQWLQQRKLGFINISTTIRKMISIMPWLNGVFVRWLIMCLSVVKLQMSPWCNWLENICDHRILTTGHLPCRGKKNKLPDKLHRTPLDPPYSKVWSKHQLLVLSIPLMLTIWILSQTNCDMCGKWPQNKMDGHCARHSFQVLTFVFPLHAVTNFASHHRK